MANTNKYEYNFYSTDASFDYRDCYGGTCYCTDYHGLTVELEKYTDKVISWSGYGDYASDIDNCKTLEELRDYLESHLDEVSEENRYGHTYTNRELFEELISFIDDTIKDQQKQCA